MTSKLFAVLFLAVTNAFILGTVEDVFTASQSKQFIYGKVTTTHGDTYEGQIRWGKEEAFWFDFFNSSKPSNENLKWLSKNEEKTLNEKDHSSKGWWGKWGNNNNWSYGSGHSHIFACQFGDIQSIKVLRGDHVLVSFKNGEEYELDGGSNDIGTQIQVNDKEMGNIKLDWDRVELVEFMDTPSGLESAYGEPLFGTVKTVHGEYEGFLQWDHDERLSRDILDGKSDDGELEIEFGKIQTIKRTRHGSSVTLKSGRTFELTGTNDVNDENRGIIVSIPNYGRVDIPWDEFEEMTFSSTIGTDQLSYSDYKGEAPIQGIVYTYDNGSFSGKLIFDLDEQFQLEMLNGVADGVEYFLPFSSLSYLEPKNRKESLVKMTNGESFILSEKVDVTEGNDGLLIFGDDSKPDYVPWSEIKYITFE